MSGVPTRHPDHRGGGDEEAERLAPGRVLVPSHRDRGVLHEVEDEDELKHYLSIVCK